MPFKEGTYQHETGFQVLITQDGTIFLSPDAPAFINLKDFFDTSKWIRIND